jgi:hypothetical protein
MIPVANPFTAMHARHWRICGASARDPVALRSRIWRVAGAFAEKRRICVK